MKGDRFFKDDMYNGFCGGFTFSIVTKTCTLGQGRLKNNPWVWDTHVTGVRIATCGKCGAGLDPGVPMPTDGG
jgi:hypothetical protein